MQVFLSRSPKDTADFAAEFAKTLKGGEVIAFTGNLGAGKTCFTSGLARGLGFKGTVTSPTFAIMNEYLGGRLDIYHFDMYRISTWEDLDFSGYFDYLDCGGVIVVEWSENITGALKGDTIFIDIENVDDNTRRITVKERR